MRQTTESTHNTRQNARSGAAASRSLEYRDRSRLLNNHVRHRTLFNPSHQPIKAGTHILDGAIVQTETDFHTCIPQGIRLDKVITTAISRNIWKPEFAVSLHKSLSQFTSSTCTGAIFKRKYFEVRVT
jgi:hypothetical protein